ncbi:hypothetical protein BGZ70_009854, partial [Mortierella alpina]
MVQTRLFLEQDPPTQAIHTGVVGFIVLVFIVARVLTTRGFAALKPGFNTRAIVTWLACTSLTLMVLYSCLIARTLYNESMAGYYPGPPVSANYEPPSNVTPFQFPVSVSFQDMSGDPEWDLSNITPPPQMDFNYVLAMKPISLYSLANRHFLFALRIVLKVSQSGLMACLLLLNTYWCSHVEALVDEGNFMSKTEMYMYWTLAAIVIIFPVTVFVGIGYGTSHWPTASRVSDLLLLLLGLAIILGYIMTCLRLRALERDSRDVNGDDTPTTLQLTYYVYCIYWLIGSMFAILVLGILYEFTLVSPAKSPVLAQVVNDIQGALWSTLVILVYPAAMFLLYPSVDVLTKPENDPAARFQKRVRRTVKDATRIRESFYLESDSANGIETGRHSSLYGLTSNSGLSLRQSDNGQPQQNQQQQHRQSIYEPKRRERMGSITAAVSEMQLIVEEEGAGPLEVIRDVDDKSVFNNAMYDASTNSATNIGTERSSKDETVKSTEGTDSPTPKDNERDAAAAKAWLAQEEHLNGAREAAGLDKAAVQEQQVLNESHSTSLPLVSIAFPAAYNVISSSSEEFAMRPILDKSKGPAATMKTAYTSHSKSAPPPLTGILKTRTSTSSARSSVGQNPSDPTDHGDSDVPSVPTRSAPAYGVRTSSAQASQHMTAGSSKSSENMPVRRRTSSGSSRQNLAASSSAPNLSADPTVTSPSPQQRRSNVTGRVDASALVAAQQCHQAPQNHSHRQQEQRPKASSDVMEIDYFGLRKFSFENHPHATPTSPPPFPYEPQSQGMQQVDLLMSPTMTGFLMADPYPSAGTRHFDGSDSEQGPASAITLSDSQEVPSGSEMNHRRSGSGGSSKKYKAPPPPIPTDLANIGANVNRDDGSETMPTTPMTPTTPPGVRPGRSLDTVVDRQFIEMANQMYDDHIVPPHVLQNISAGSMEHKPSESPSLTTRMHQSLPSSLPPAPQTPTPPAPVIRNDTLQATMAGQQQQQQQQQQQEQDSSSQRGMSPPTKSPYRGRESFESRIAQTAQPTAGSGQNVPGGPCPSTPPSPASTASPTIASAATLPRPLTPAWYETKTNYASTNDVLSHYNAVMRGGNPQVQQQQQQQQPQHQYQQSEQGIGHDQYYKQHAIGPLDKVSMEQRSSDMQYLPSIHPMQMLTVHPQQHPATQPQQLHQQQSQVQVTRQDYAQPRMGSADSFGVIRKSLTQPKGDTSRSTLQNMHPNEPQQQRIQQQSQQLPEIDRHSFMMPSASISAYSTWTGDLSDVTNTSGEVSVGAFLDRKQASATHYQRRKSAEKPTSSSLSASTNSGGHSSQGQPRQDERSNTQDVRKSQTSAYSMGSSFGAGSSSRQSAGAYSNYSYNSGFGSGPVVVSASLSSDGHSSGANNTNSDSGGAGVIAASIPSRRQSGSHKRRISSGGHGTAVGGSADGASVTETTSSRSNTMRLSAFGPDEHNHHAPVVDHRVGEHSRETLTTDRAFYLEDIDAQTSQERERRIQQEWIDRRAAVKKDSKNRLEQLHKQQQQLEEHERHLLEQLHQLRAEEGQRPQEFEEPYRLNSVYFKSSAELLNQLGTHPPSPPSVAGVSSSVVAQEYPSSKTESVSLSASKILASTSSLCESSTRSTAAATTTSPSPSQHPAMALISSSTPEFNVTSTPYSVASAQSSSYRQSQESERSNRGHRNNNESAEDTNPLIPSSSSYAEHHQAQ